MVAERMSTKKPMVLVYAGPNGSGKSTFISHLGHTGEYTNADDVVASTGMSNIDAAKFVDEKRYFRSLANIKELLELCDILHVYDNTLSEPRRIIRKHKEDISLFPNSIWSLDELLKLVNGTN